MKLFLTLVGVALAFAVGYRLEPNFRANLTGKSANVEAPSTAPVETDPKSAVVIAPPPPPAPVVAPIPAVEPTPAPTPAPETELALEDSNLEPAIDAESQPANEDEATDLAAAEDEMDQTPVVEEAPEPAAAAATPPATPEANDVVSLMKAGIAAGALKDHIKPDQILGWKDTGEETIDGQAYQTGLVAYRAKTIFGENSTIEAKALVRDGKIERWIWPKSGMEIE